jgi:hypothetical protein
VRRCTTLKPSAGTQIPAKVRIAVRVRDRGYCVCDRAGFPEEVQAFCKANYTEPEIDHVRGSGGMGMKSPTELDNLVLLSGWCHRWKTEHGREARPLLLAYLSRITPEHTHVDPMPGCAQCYEVWG